MARKLERDLASRIADGTYRPGRHGARLDASAPEGLAEPEPAQIPKSISPDLRGLWRAYTEELALAGTLVHADLLTLESAFLQLAAARKLQTRLDTLLDNPASSESAIGKLQSAIASANGQAAKTFAKFGLSSPIDRAKMRAANGKKKKEAPPSNSSPKKSIREVLARPTRRPASPSARSETR